MFPDATIFFGHKTVRIFFLFLSVIHSLKYFQTTSSEIPNFPDYLVVGHVNDVPISHYDSKNRKFEAKHEWMNKMETDVAHYWERLTQYNIDIEQTFKVNFEIAKERFNQTGGVHMIQVMTGCEWDDETDEVVDGWEHLSYDGEDFLSFELQTQRWIAIQQQAFDTKHKWDQLDNLNQYWKHYITEICPHWLKKLMSHGGDFLMRTELPVMSLLQKTPSSPITCHVTGFYPYKAALFWRKDGADLYEDVEMGETLPNHDGTFQMTAHLQAELPADAEDRYECVFQLSGVEGDMVTKLDRRLILSNERDRGEPAGTPTRPDVFLLTSSLLLSRGRNQEDDAGRGDPRGAPRSAGAAARGPRQASQKQTSQLHGSV
uniref:Ig-like domain-containing protein n=1 Tax=Hippocampus comes TaxID=109280 RepID=A0A3Q2Z8T1_HIPCM